MPVINTNSSPSVIASFDGNSSFTANGTLALYLNARFDGTSLFTANGSQTQAGSAQFVASSSFHANGHILGEPDLFGLALFDGTGSFTANLNVFFHGYASFDGQSSFVANGELNVQETYELNLIVDILPASPAGNYIRQQGRLKIDGVEIPFITANYSEPEGTAGSDLQIQLARVADRNLLTSFSVIEFGIGRKIAGVWDESTFETLLNTGELDSSNFSIGWQNNGPTDNVSFSSISGLSAKLNKVPETDLVIYDPLRTTINQTDFETLYDTEGRPYLTELRPIGGLSLYGLFTEVFVTRCGFSGYRTNLPDFPIQRVDCSFTNSYLESIRGYFGMFDPAILEVEGEIWIVDTTNVLPVGFPAPRSVNIFDYVNAGVSQNLRRVDAMLLTYTEDARNFDYTTNRSDIAFGVDDTGTFGQPGYTTTSYEKFFIQYRKFSQPAVVIKENLIRETRTTYDYLGTIIYETDERYFYDSSARINLRTKTVRQVVPEMPAATSFLNQQTSEENERFEYKSHTYKPREQYLGKRTLDIRGLIVNDNDNQQAGRPFTQDIVTATRSGNVSEGLTATYGPIKSVVETASPNRDGTVSIRSVEVDHLTGVVNNEINENRSGEIGLNGLSPKQNRILVFDAENALRTTERVESFHAGEMPLTTALPLARRVLKKRKTKSKALTMNVIGYDPGIKRGSIIAAKHRISADLGSFLISGRSVNIGRDGVFMNLNGKEV